MNQSAAYSKNAIPSPDDITRLELPNGIIVLARANFNSPSVTVGGAVNVGALFDTDELLGLSDFTASTLMRGTKSRDFHQIYEELEAVGAGLHFNGGTHTTGFSGKALVEDLDLLLDILAEALRFPTFPEKHIEQQRARILTGLDLRAQSTYDQAALAFDSLVYPNHPYSRPEEGHPETVRVVRLTDIKAFHAKHYGPKGMRVAVVGGIDPQKAIEKVQAALGDWENPQQPAPPDLPPWSPLSKSQQVRVDVSGKSQSDLILGTAGPARGAPNFLAASLGNNILGQFGMMGRIGEVVREEAGLAYYASSNVSGSLGPGPWSVSAGVNPKNENQAIELILKEIRRFVTELVSEDELSDSQANYIGSLPLSLESNRGVASSLLHLEKHNLGLDYYVRYPALVRAVTRQDVLAAASRYLDPDKFAVAVAGPPK